MPFNHAVPTSWLPGGADWDGENLPPVHNPAFPPRFNAAHMALIPRGIYRGQVLVWNYMRIPNGSVRNKQHWSIVNIKATPVTFINNDLTVDTANKGDPFCAGTAWTLDGDLLVAGGDRWINNYTQLAPCTICWRFDPLRPVSNMWVEEGVLLHYARYYPNVTAMPDGTLHVTGGSDLSATRDAAKTFEVFNPIQRAPGAGVFLANLGKTGNPPYFDGPNVICSEELFEYPRDIVLTSGKKFTAGMMDLGYRVLFQNTPTGPVWELMTMSPGIGREYGSVVPFPNLGGPGGGNENIVLRIGGGATGLVCPRLGPTLALNTVDICNANNPTGTWSWVALPWSMQYARINLNATLLPNGTVLVTGGKTDVANPFQTNNPVLQAESFNGTGWTTLASATIRRGYHSTALLLEDGRVLVGGGEQREMDYEFFSPPYLTAPQGQRPVIVNAPSTLTMTIGSSTEYSLEYQPLPLGEHIAKVVLMAPGAVTHHFDMHQRYVELALGLTVPLEGAPLSRSFKAPPTANHAPPGYYMLFFVSNKGVPSVATWVLLQ